MFATTLGVNAEAKDKAMEQQVFYRTVKVDGLSIFYTRPSVQVRPVTSARAARFGWQFPHAFQYAAARLGCVVRVISQDFGDGDNRKAKIVSNVLHAECHKSKSLPLQLSSRAVNEIVILHQSSLTDQCQLAIISSIQLAITARVFQRGQA
jgi:hypothetical protein